MRMANVVLAAALVASVATAGELSWPDLVRRSELWPAQCTLKTSLRLQGGEGARAGDLVDVLELRANEIVVGTSDRRLRFAVKPHDTDALARAEQIWASLTPAQRELTYASLLQREELWPYRVRLTEAFELSNGRHVEPGEAVILMRVERGKLQVASERLVMSFSIEPRDTDLMSQARELVAAGKTAPGRTIEEMDGKLINAATGDPEPRDPSARPRYIVFLRGSNTCPLTRRFIPALLSFYKEMKPRHPDFEVVYVRADASVADMNKFAREMGFSWPALTTGDLFFTGREFGSKMPQLLVVDRSGTVVANGVQATAPAALDRLRALLEQPAQTPRQERRLGSKPILNEASTEGEA